MDATTTTAATDATAIGTAEQRWASVSRGNGDRTDRRKDKSLLKRGGKARKSRPKKNWTGTHNQLVLKIESFKLTTVYYSEMFSRTLYFFDVEGAGPLMTLNPVDSQDRAWFRKRIHFHYVKAELPLGQDEYVRKQGQHL